MKKFNVRTLIITILTLAMLVCSMFAVACSKNPKDSNGSGEESPFILNLHQNKLSLYDTVQLYVPDFDDITWASSDSTIASVNDDGLVYGEKYGTATITATSGKYSDTCYINVENENKVPSIITNLNNSSLAILIDETFDLDCKILFNNIEYPDGTFTFASADPEVCDVDEEGVVTPKKYGDTTITVRAEWRGFDSAYLTETINFSVNPNLFIDLDIEDAEIYNTDETVEGVDYFDTTELTWSIILDGQDVTNTATVEWVVSDPTVVQVDDGVVTGLKAGTTEISFKYTVEGGKTFQSLPVEVTVLAPTKTIESEEFVYEIGSNGIPKSIFADATEFYGVKIGIAVFGESKIDFSGENILFTNKFASTYVGEETEMIFLTDKYNYKIDVLCVTHAISTAQEFIEFLSSYSGTSNASSEYYAVLTDHIDLKDVSLPSKTYNNDRFLGKFNGRGYSIANAHVNNNGGLFGGLHYATIENFAMINATTTSNSSYQAFVAGYLYPYSVVKNIYVQGTVLTAPPQRGIFHANNNGDVSNIIANLNFAKGLNRLYVGMGCTSEGMLGSATETYVIGNMDAFAGKKDVVNSTENNTVYISETNDKVYVDGKEFLEEKADAITSSNGWSEYWTNENGVLLMRDILLLYQTTEVVDETINVATYSFDSESSEFVKKDFKIDLSNTVGSRTVKDVFLGGIKATDLQDNVATFNAQLFSERTTYDLLILTDAGCIAQPVYTLSHEISTADQFVSFINSWDTNNQAITRNYHVVVTQDINCATSTIAKIELGRASMGHWKDDRFYGVFDGQGHTISNISLNNSCLFGSLREDTTHKGIIRNLALVNVLATNKSVLLGDSLSGTVENVYVQGTISNATGNGGAIAIMGSMKVINCVFDVDYATNTTDSFTFNGDGSSASTNLTNVYAIGNAKQIQAGDSTAPYADGNALLTELEGKVNAQNGWSDCWKLDSYGLWLYNNLVIQKDTSLQEKTFYAVKNAFVDSEFVAQEGYRLDLSNVLGGSTPEFVLVNGSKVSVSDGKITISDAVGKISDKGVVSVAVSGTIKNYPLVYASHAIGTKEEFESYMTYTSKSSTSNTSSGTYAVLTNDIDYNNTSVASASTHDTNHYYMGTFDGQGYAIKNAKVSNSSLFGALNKGVIKNLALINVKADSNSGGVLVTSQNTFGKGVVDNVYIQLNNSTRAANGFGVSPYVKDDVYTNCIFEVNYNVEADASLTERYVINGKETAKNVNIADSVFGIGNADKFQPGDDRTVYSTGNALAEAYFNGTVSFTGFNSYWTFEKTENSATIKFGDNVIGTYTKA